MSTPLPSGATNDTQLHRWGTITLAAGLLVSFAAPIYLFTVEGLWPGWPALAACVAGVVALYAVTWIVEPVTFFPVLGVAGSYQAWLVGNITNKLLPAAVTAQNALRADPGTRRAELISIAAISGAVIVHIVSLALLVAIGGNFILSVLPPVVVDAFKYVLPAILGPVLVQIITMVRSWRITLMSGALALTMVLVVLPLVPGLSTYALLIVVACAIVGAILLMRGSPAARATVTARTAAPDASGEPQPQPTTTTSQGGDR